MDSGTRSHFTGALWFPVCWVSEWLPWRPFRFGSVWKGWIAEEDLRREPCVEARGLSDNGKRMGRKLRGEAEQGSKKGRVSGNSPQQCSKHEAS